MASTCLYFDTSYTLHIGGIADSDPLLAAVSLTVANSTVCPYVLLRMSIVLSKADYDVC